MMNMDNTYFQLPFREFLKEKAQNRIIFPVTFEELGITEQRSAAEMLFIINGFMARAKQENIDLLVFLCYYYKKYIFITKEFSNMKKVFCIDIPYGHWNQYESMIAEVNNAVSKNGTVILAVSNIPYFLKCKLIIECVDGEEDIIKQIIHNNDLNFDFSKGLEEIHEDIANRMWNILVLSQMPSEQIHNTIQPLFYFSHIDDLKLQGYDWENEAKRKQIFISYSHKNQSIVRNVVDELLECELNIFVDYRSIDYGEKIIEKITQGLNECDLCVFFLSNQFKESYYGKHELSSIWNYVITKKKKWLFVILDDVNIDEIYDGLSFYKYFKLNNNIEELVNAIKKLMLS